MEILIPLLIFLGIVVAIVTIPVIVLRIYLTKAGKMQPQSDGKKGGKALGSLAGATIISAHSQPSTDSARSVSRVDLRLEVQPPDGAPYQATTSWLVDVDILPQMRPGQSISIKIDSRDPQRIYPNMSGAEFFFWG